MQLLLGKREEEVAQVLMKVDKEAAAKVNSQKSLCGLESQLGKLLDSLDATALQQDMWTARKKELLIAKNIAKEQQKDRGPPGSGHGCLQGQRAAGGHP